MLSSYDQAVGQIIVKSRVATSLPPLDNVELAASISAWAELLFGVIPENQLEWAYVRAMQDKDSSFALTAPGLIQGHRNACASEAASPRQPQDRNLLTGDVCPRCHGTGFEQYREDGYVNSRRCDHVIDEDDVSMF